MKRTILAIALASILAACGSASESQAPAQVATQAAPEVQQPASTELPPTTLPRRGRASPGSEARAAAGTRCPEDRPGRLAQFQ